MQLKSGIQLRLTGDSAEPAQVGVIHNLIPIQPLNSERDSEAADFFNHLHNILFLDAVKRGVIEFKFRARKIFASHIKDKLDWLGVNYYSRLVVQGERSIIVKLFTGIHSMPEPVKGYGFYCDPNSRSLDGRPSSDFGWEVYPEGLEESLKLASKYKVPLMITENGIADSMDSIRPSFIVTHLKVLERLIEEGLEIKGYLHWALTDNYEWAHGFRMKFGLYAVDLSTKKRIKRRSAEMYRKIVEMGEVPKEPI